MRCVNLQGLFEKDEIIKALRSAGIEEKVPQALGSKPTDVFDATNLFMKPLLGKVLCHIAVRTRNIVSSTMVLVNGLSARPDLNGTKGQILELDEDKLRYQVQLQSGGMLSLQPENAILPRGTCALLFGLDTEPIWNRTWVTILAYLERQQVYNVQPNGPRQLKVPLSNVLAVEPLDFRALAPGQGKAADRLHSVDPEPSATKICQEEEAPDEDGDLPRGGDFASQLCNLQSRKAKAAADEDFLLAKQLLGEILALRKAELQRLCKAKAAAVEVEDYLEANRFKKQIE